MRRVAIALAFACACGGSPPTPNHTGDMPSNHLDPPAASRDACSRKADIEKRGDAAISAGEYDKALAQYTQIVDCGDVQMIRKAYMAACDGSRFPRAKALYRRLPNDGTTRSLRQLCLRRGFDPQ